MKLYIGYEFTSALGKTIRKIVICNSDEEYRAVKEMIDDAGYDVIEFWAACNAKTLIERR